MRLTFTFALLIAVVGCGPSVAPVSGKVTLDQKPLANAMVTFMPDSDAKNPGPGSTGKTDANGEYSLQLNTGGTKGAMVGKHKVSITAYDGDDKIPDSSGIGNPFRKRLLPPRYNSDTKLTIDVPPGGTTSANFDLKSE